MISLLKFPRNVINRILRFLDCEVIVRMRKVNKSSKEFVDAFILRTQTSDDLGSLSISRNDNSKIELHMSLSCWWESHVWKNFVSTALDKLAITKATLKVSLLRVVYIYSMNLSIDSRGMQRFLEYLKPQVRSFKIDTFQLSDDNPKTVRMCTEFVSGMFVETVTLGLRKSTTQSQVGYYTQHLARIVRTVLRKPSKINFDQFLAFIANVNPSHVNFSSQHYELGRDSVKFLIRLADMMKSIFIFHECDSATAHVNIIPIVISILSRKCEKLIIRDSCRNVFVSPSEAEHLLQFLHHSEKKLSLTLLRTQSELVNGQNGLYNVTPLTTSHVSIEHMDFKRPIL